MCGLGFGVQSLFWACGVEGLSWLGCGGPWQDRSESELLFVDDAC